MPIFFPDQDLSERDENTECTDDAAAWQLPNATQ